MRVHPFCELKNELVPSWNRYDDAGSISGGYDAIIASYVNDSGLLVIVIDNEYDDASIVKNRIKESGLSFDSVWDRKGEANIDTFLVSDKTDDELERELLYSFDC